MNIYKILSVYIVNWNEFNNENATFMREFEMVEEISPTSFIEHINLDL